MATMVPPQKNVEYIFYVGLVSQADTKLLQNNPTLAAGDVLVSTDGGATSNLDTLPAVTPASSDMVKVTVSTTEMNGDNIIIVFSDAAGSEWCDLLINIQTSAQSLDTMDTNIDDIETDTGTAGVKLAADQAVNVTKWLGTAAATPTVAGVPEVDITYIAGAAVATGSAQLGVNVVNIGASAAAGVLETAVDNGLDNAIGGSPTADSVAQRIKAIDLIIEASGAGDLAAILADTNELQLLISASKIAAQVKGLDDIDLSATMKTSVNAEVVDALGTDTLSELSQGIPAATPTVKAALMLLYMIARNQLTTTSTELGVYNDAGTKIAKKVLSDDGTTYNEAEMVSGA